MLITTFIVAIGLTAGAWAATSRGYRLSGVVVISLLAIYTLINFSAFPIFVLSIMIAYVGIVLLQERWLVYGRRLLFMAIILGAAVPVLIALLFDIWAFQNTQITELDFLGSILPGIAAYNYYRADPDRRLRELIASVGLFIVLVTVGVGSLVLWYTPPSISSQIFGHSVTRYFQPLLQTAGSDLAGLLGIEAFAGPPGVGSLGTVSAVVLLGLFLAELARSRWGLRPAGVIALPLIVLFSLRIWWVVPLYLGVSVLSYLFIQLLHTWSLLYGRALLSISGLFGVLIATVVIGALGLPGTLAVFFAGLLGGIGAYNLHIIAPRERVANAAVSAGIFVGLFVVARALIVPLPAGLTTTITWMHALVATIVMAAAALAILDLERTRPSRREFQEWTLAPEEVES